MYKLTTIFFVILSCFFVQGCSSSNVSIRPYHIIGAELNKSYKLTGSDLIITYDLGRIDHNNYIYSADLGLVINDKNYTERYIQKFKVNYKSSILLYKEARKKIVRIYKFLLKLHAKYRILSNNKYQYVKRLSKTDLTRLNPRKELGKLDRIMASVPVMPPLFQSKISSNYGNRNHPVKKRKKFHCGLDFVAKNDAPVYAAANGRVIFAGRQNGYGKVVEIQHGTTITSFYAHLNKINIRKGQAISRGQIIGTQGKTGTATREHLHFEIRIKKRHVNPYDFLAHAYRCC